MTQINLTRRSFILSASTAASATIAGSVAHGFAANETINVACIGTGGRCQTLMKSLAKIEKVRMSAVCDVWDDALKAGKTLADPRAVASKNYKEILDRKDIDAVLIGSPDHWHVPLTIAACNARKDVYVEKPLTHDLAEGKTVVEAQNANERIVQVGTQQRSMPHIIKAKELIKAGRIGKVVKVRMSWNRNSDRVRKKNYNIDPKSVDWTTFLGGAPKQEFDEYRFRNWRWFWDFGGGIFTDLMVHWIDVAHWILEVDHPQKAVSLGEFNTAKGVWETPDTVQTLLSYPGNIQMHFEGTFSNAREGAMIQFMGTEATLYIDRGRFEIIPEWNKKGASDSLILGKNPSRRGADFYDEPDGELLHLTDWVNAMRSRKRPSAPAEAGVSGAGAAHLANLALRSGKSAEWKAP
jgi:predicted dehydrogenase